MASRDDEGALVPQSETDRRGGAGSERKTGGSVEAGAVRKAADAEVELVLGPRCQVAR